MNTRHSRLINNRASGSSGISRSPPWRSSIFAPCRFASVSSQASGPPRREPPCHLRRRAVGQPSLHGVFGSRLQVDIGLRRPRSSGGSLSKASRFIPAGHHGFGLQLAQRKRLTCPASCGSASRQPRLGISSSATIDPRSFRIHLPRPARAEIEFIGRFQVSQLTAGAARSVRDFLIPARNASARRNCSVERGLSSAGSSTTSNSSRTVVAQFGHFRSSSTCQGRPHPSNGQRIPPLHRVGRAFRHGLESSDHSPLPVRFVLERLTSSLSSRESAACPGFR